MKSILLILATIFQLVIISLAETGETSNRDQQAEATKKVYSDKILRFNIPDGGKVSAIPSENTHIVFTGDTSGFYYIRVIGPAENPAISKQRAENSRNATLKKEGIPTKSDDGSIVKIGKISKITEKEINGQIHFIFTFEGSAETKEESGDAITAMGYGNMGGRALWYFHTGAQNEKYPDDILNFLKSIIWKKSQNKEPVKEPK